MLGPLLFLIYVNDLPGYVRDTHFTLFADDTTMLRVSSSLESLQNQLREVRSRASDWFEANKLCLNQSKTETIIFSLRDIRDIDNPSGVKFLGTVLDARLCWDQHVESVSGKLCKIVYLLGSLRDEVSIGVLRTTYFALFQSAMSYAILNWGHSSHAGSVFRVQRRAIRSMLGLNYREDVKEHFKMLNILTLPSLYIWVSLLHVRSHIDEYVFAKDVHAHNTRHRNNIFVDFTRLSRSRNAFNYYGPVFYNKMPNELRTLSTSSFSNRVKEFLLNEAFYSVHEFLNCTNIF